MVNLGANSLHKFIHFHFISYIFQMPLRQSKAPRVIIHTHVTLHQVLKQHPFCPSWLKGVCTWWQKPLKSSHPSVDIHVIDLFSHQSFTTPSSWKVEKVTLSSSTSKVLNRDSIDKIHVSTLSTTFLMFYPCKVLGRA